MRALVVRARAAVLPVEDRDAPRAGEGGEGGVGPRGIGVDLELDVAAACQKLGIAVYLGGMFEVDVGRRQLQALAALLCPDGPNDVAPIGRAGETPARPARIDVDALAVGFGA